MKRVGNVIIVMIGMIICGFFLQAENITVHAESVHYLRPYQWCNMDTYDSENLEKSFTMMDQKYTHGMKTTNYGGEAYAVFNLDGSVTSVSFVIGHLDDESTSAAELKIYLDENILDDQTKELTGDMISNTVSVNVTGKKQLKISISAKGYYPRYGVGNIVMTGAHNYECDYTNIATVQTEGLLTYRCIDCGHQYTEKDPAKTYCTNYIIPYQTGNTKVWEETWGSNQALSVMGKKYYRAISSTQYSGSSNAYYNLNSQYSNVSFSVGHIDNESCARGRLNVYKDKVLVKTMELTETMLVQSVSINTVGVTQLGIEIEALDYYDYYPRYAVFNIEATPVSGGKREHSFNEEVLVEAQFRIEGSIRHVCSVCGAYYVTTSPALTRDLSDKNISVSMSDKEYTYDGSEKKPTISVRYDRDDLVAGKDYSVSYSNNINPGEAKVTITGIGDYTGSATYTYKINAAKTTDNNNGNTNNTNNTNSNVSNNNTGLSSQISINIKNKKTYKKSKKVTISSGVYLRSVTLNGKNIITSNYVKKVSFKLSKYKKQLKKKGKWNKLVVTNSYGKQKTIKFKTK